METFIDHYSIWDISEIYTTNFFTGASYELADGLTLALGIGNLDADNPYNRVGGGSGVLSRPMNGVFVGTLEGRRSFNAIASVKVEF